MSGLRRIRRETITAGRSGRQVVVERRMLQPTVDGSVASDRIGKAKREAMLISAATIVTPKINTSLAADVARMLRGKGWFPAQLWGDVL